MSNILIIDDDQAIRVFLRQTLEKDGHEVVDAADGEEGLRYYRQKPADLVITDILMPGGDGLSTIHELRREFPDARIIAISGGGSTGELGFLTRARDLGALRTLPKPFSVTDVREAVREVLGENR